jgi:hypothetical protein
VFRLSVVTIKSLLEQPLVIRLSTSRSSLLCETQFLMKYTKQTCYGVAMISREHLGILRLIFQIAQMLLQLNRQQLAQFKSWVSEGFPSPYPQIVKWEVIRRYGGVGLWIETGTYYGETTTFLAKLGKKVISIEPDLNLMQSAKLKFTEVDNIEIIFGTSELILNDLLPSLQLSDLNDISFWLDGHYSGDLTFKGEIDTPIVIELEYIDKYVLKEVEKVTILIDDFRCFLPDYLEHLGYPKPEYLVEWATSRNLHWTIEADIFIIQKH